MSDPLEFIPAYISPLTDAQHARIGRIAILWGQIEHLVEQILPRVCNLTWEELISIKVASKPIAAKVDLLNAAKERLADEPLKERVREFCTSINETKVARNHLFHGMWGWRGSSRAETVVPAARKTTNPEQPLSAERLPELEKKLCRASRLGEDLVNQLNSELVRVKYTRYLHHDDTDSFPEWLQRWSERNPLDDEEMDRNSKLGTLPHLKTPYPPK
ncbi:MAG: hypothetical protein ABJP70_04100 [Erythrobacter sp.]